MLRNLNFATLALLVLVSLIHAAEWQPATPRLTTPWTAEVTPDTAWQEYPRPQMVREEWTNLNGLWQYAIVPLVEKGLAAAIYTQTTDVEGEVNGLMTYDRKVLKFDADALRAMHTEIYKAGEK